VIVRDPESRMSVNGFARFSETRMDGISQTTARHVQESPMESGFPQRAFAARAEKPNRNA